MRQALDEGLHLNTGVTPARSKMTAVSIRLALIATALFVVLFLVMWAPVWAGNEGWLFLYPLLLIAWLLVEALAIAGTITGIIGIKHSKRDRLPRSQIESCITTSCAAVLSLHSLPILWFGTFPFFFSP